MIGFDRCVDFRYPEGHPGVAKALADGTRVVRCVSLPVMEEQAAAYMAAGIRVLAVYTGESDAAGRYIMASCSGLIVGNEPQFAYPNSAAAWPTGSADDYVNVFSHVAYVLVPSQHPGLPLIGAGFWASDYLKWALVASRLPSLSAASVHVYPIATGHTPGTVRSHLRAYAAVRADLPLICGEWTARFQALAYRRVIMESCEAALWYGPGNPTHALEGTPEYGILALSRS